MPEPELSHHVSEVLQPVSPPPAPPPGPGPARPRRGTSTWIIVLLILCLLGLAGSVVVNVLLLADVDVAFEHGGRGMQTSVVRAGSRSETVALYTVQGILDGRSAARFEQFYKAVIDDNNVKAVVLRVASPGGGVTASDQMCELVKRLRSKGKKVVVSMGSLAASGGYYISAPANEIYAEPTTITGSIGVIAGWVVLKGTLDKIGAEPVIIKSSHAEGWKDEMSSLSAPHDYQRRHVQSVLDELQKRFEDEVQAGRGNRLKTRSATYEIPPRDDGAEPKRHSETEPFNGKIYLASKAKALGLIDRIGYQDAAITRAAALAGLSRHRVVRYTRRRGMMEILLESRTRGGAVEQGVHLLDKLQTPRFLMMYKAD